MEGNKVVEVEGVKKYYELRKGFFSIRRGASIYVKAVDNVTFHINEGEILGLVGESGCGKTTTGRLLTRLETPTEGRILFRDTDIAALEGSELRDFRKNVQMIFQNPYESLNPRFTIFQTVNEPLHIHGLGETLEERMDMVVRAVEDAGLVPAEEFLERFPHELSGGQRQRVAIARALVLDPRVIVADEPVSMLDVSIRAGVMNLMLDLRAKYQIPYLFITHDIAVARYMSDRIAVMYLGELAEIGPAEVIISDPVHPYTRALISAVPVPDPEHKHGLVDIKGELPSVISLPTGCRFHPRCPIAKDICKEVDPAYIEVAPGHLVKCHFAEELHEEGYDIEAEVVSDESTVAR